MRVHRAPQRLDRLGSDAARHHAVPPLVEPDRGVGVPLPAVGALVPGPERLGGGGGPGPEPAVQHRGVRLLRPQRHLAAQHPPRLVLRQPVQDVVVVDALPRLEGRAPGPARAAGVVEQRHAIVLLLLHVVPAVVAHPAAVPAVQVVVGRGGDDDAVPGRHDALGVGGAVVPRLQHGGVAGQHRLPDRHLGPQEDVLPVHRRAVQLVHQERPRRVHEQLQQAVVGAAVRQEAPHHGVVLPARRVHLVGARVEVRVREQGRQVAQHVLRHAVRLGVERVQLPRAGLRCQRRLRLGRPELVRAGHDLRVRGRPRPRVP